MRFLLTLLFLSVVCTCARAQVGSGVDAEYVSWCMVDVLGSGQVVRFTRLINVATLEVVDIDQVAGTAYTVAGSLLSCDAYDLQEAMEDPTTDFYEDCQCSYTITQENNRVISIDGGNTQEYTVEFQEVVRRQCAGQNMAVVVHRDTLTETAPTASTNRRLQYSFSFTAAGQYLDQVDLRGYTGISSQTISIDLNPNTVQATYPALTLNTADFTYDGGNSAAMATAWLEVIQYAVAEAIGIPENTITTSSFGGQVFIFTNLLHEPEGPYVIQPQPGDTDYSFQSTIPGNPIGIALGGAGLVTRTSNWSEECEDIFVEKSGLYLTWNKETPLSLVPVLNVTTNLKIPQSNPQVFCDAPPSVCADLATSSVAVDGCVQICDTVDVRVVGISDTIPVQVITTPADSCGATIPGHAQLSGTSATYVAGTYNSLSVTVTAGPVAVTIDGQTADYPAGYSVRWAAPDPCDRLSQSIIIDAAAGSVLIATLQ